jgi:vitamin B12 transporter
MFNKKLFLAFSFSALVLSQPSNAVIGPIKITLNTEYRTSNPVIGEIATTIKLDKSQIKNTGASTFTDLLQKIPSVSFEGGQGNLRALRLRGNEARHTLLLLDGQSVAITGAQPNLDVIPVDQIERIEISKGPFSSLYGPGAIGGVIHVFTDKDSNSITGSKIDISSGSKGTTKVNLNTYFKDENNYFDFAATDFHTDGIDARGNGDLDPIDRTTFGLNLGGQITEDTSFSLNLLDTKAIIQYDDLYDGTIYEAEVLPDNNLRQMNAGISHNYGKRSKINLDIMNQETQRRNEKYELNTITVINETDLPNSKISLGLSNTIDKDLNNLSTPSVVKKIKHTDFFGQWQGLIIDNEISVGARLIDHDKFSSHTTYNLNWARDISNTTRLKASYGSATNLPGHFKNNANLVAGKTSLKPERSKNLELGVYNSFEWGNAELKLYKSRVTDAFKYFSASPYYYVNDGTVNIQGAELSIGTELLGWDLNSNIDFNKAIAASSDLQKGRRPNRSISINLNKSSGKWKRNINWVAHSWAWDRDDHTNGKNGGYGLLNLRTSYDFTEDLSIYLNRNNALDKNYEMAKGYDTLGKTTTIGLTYNF